MPVRKYCMNIKLRYSKIYNNSTNKLQTSKLKLLYIHNVQLSVASNHLTTWM